MATTATHTTKKARTRCTCPICRPTSYGAFANGVFMCRGGEQIEFVAFHHGIQIGYANTRGGAEDKLNAHRHEIARRALQAGTLTPDQADVIAEDLAPAADLAHDVAQAAAEAQHNPLCTTCGEAFIPAASLKPDTTICDPCRLSAPAASGGVVVETWDDVIARNDAEAEQQAATADMLIVPNPALLDHPNHADLKAMHTQARAMIAELDAMAADEDDVRALYDEVHTSYNEATAFLAGEEARDFCEEARAELEPVVPSFATDYIGEMIDGCEARINALFPTEAEVVRAGRDVLYPAMDADLTCTEIGLDLSREITALEQHDTTHLLTARAYLIVARSAVENARKALKEAIAHEQRDEQRQADKAA